MDRLPTASCTLQRFESGCAFAAGGTDDSHRPPVLLLEPCSGMPTHESAAVFTMQDLWKSRQPPTPLRLDELLPPAAAAVQVLRWPNLPGSCSLGTHVLLDHGLCACCARVRKDTSAVWQKKYVLLAMMRALGVWVGFLGPATLQEFCTAVQEPHANGVAAIVAEASASAALGLGDAHRQLSVQVHPMLLSSKLIIHLARVRWPIGVASWCTHS